MATEIYRQKVNDLNARAKRAGAKGRLNAADLYAVLEYCGNHCQMPGCTNTDVTFDHVEPLEHGGLNARSNLGLLCESHNKGKSDNIVPDYREGRICPDDYVASVQQETYKKHDWAAIEHEYVTTNKSMRELSKEFQVHENQLMNRAVVERWHKKRETFTSNLLAEANSEVSTRAAQLIADEKFDVLKEGISLYKDAVERWQIGGNKVELREIVDLWKPLAAALGEVTERTQNNVSESEDTDALFARIDRLFDGGQAERIVPYCGEDREESGAGWTD